MPSRIRISLVVAVSVALLGGVFASPVAAIARTATRTSLSASSLTAKVYRPLTLTGRLLTSSGRALGGRTVSLEYRTSLTSAWKTAARAKTNSTGWAKFSARPCGDTYYRVRYPGSTTYAPSASSSKKIMGHHYETKFWEQFSGSAVSTATWTPSMQWGNYTTGLLQTYTPSALTLEHGKLVITGRERTPTKSDSNPYYSGVVSSHGSSQYNFTYGFVETRAKIPAGMGLWPGVWMLPTDPDAAWEIDVLEARGQLPCRNDMTLHFGDSQVKYTYTGSDLSAGYHTFGVDWNHDRVIWYRDGIERYRVSNPAQIPDIPLYLIANMQMGGWGGVPNSYTSFPAHFYVDYIRVYQHD